MPVSQKTRITVPDSRQIWILITLAFAAFTVKAAMAYLTYGTNDVSTWQQDLIVYHEQGSTALYRDGVLPRLPDGTAAPRQVFSHPPSMINVLRLWGVLAEESHLPLQFWMRLFCALADAGSLIVLWRMTKELPALRLRPATVMLVAISPISILVSGFHGNTDPIMVFFLLLCVYWLETHRSDVVAGLFIGLACCVKIVPILFLPAVFFYVWDWRRLIKIVVSAGGTITILGMPFLAKNFFLVLQTIGKYQSTPTLAAELYSFLGIAPPFRTLALLAVCTLAGILMNRPVTRLPLFAQFGVLASLFLLLAPGFAVQYLVWSMPWIVYLGFPVTAVYLAIAGAFLATTYTHWSGGFPWFYAKSIGLDEVSGLLLLACWYMLAVLVLMYVSAWRKNLSGRLHPSQSPMSPGEQSRVCRGINSAAFPECRVPR